MAPGAQVDCKQHPDRPVAEVLGVNVHGSSWWTERDGKEGEPEPGIFEAEPAVGYQVLLALGETRCA